MRESQEAEEEKENSSSVFVSPAARYTCPAGRIHRGQRLQSGSFSPVTTRRDRQPRLNVPASISRRCFYPRTITNSWRRFGSSLPGVGCTRGSLSFHLLNCPGRRVQLHPEFKGNRGEIELQKGYGCIEEFFGDRLCCKFDFALFFRSRTGRNGVRQKNGSEIIIRLNNKTVLAKFFFNLKVSSSFLQLI